MLRAGPVPRTLVAVTLAAGTLLASSAAPPAEEDEPGPIVIDIRNARRGEDGVYRLPDLARETPDGDYELPNGQILSREELMRRFRGAGGAGATGKLRTDTAPARGRTEQAAAKGAPPAAAPAPAPEPPPAAQSAVAPRPAGRGIELIAGGAGQDGVALVKEIPVLE